MYSEQNHIIEKVFMEVNTLSEREAQIVNNSVSFYLNDELFPALDELLNKYNNGIEILRFDSLEVDCRIKDWNDLESVKFELLSTIERKITQLEVRNENPADGEVSRDNTAQLIKADSNRQNTFFFFVVNGYLPWYGKQEHISELTKSENWNANLKQESFLSAFKSVLKKNKKAVKRLVAQFSDELIIDLLEILNVLPLVDKTKMVGFLVGTKINSRSLFLECLLNLSIHSSKQMQYAAEFVRKYISETNDGRLTTESAIKAMKVLNAELQLFLNSETIDKLFSNLNEDFSKTLDEILSKNSAIELGEEPEKLANSNVEKEPSFFENYKNEIVLRNAGLVLLCPFLKLFFEQLHWLTKSDRIIKHKQLVAVQSLHYLASGNESFFEGDLTLEKFLCGLPLNAPIPQKSLLTNAVKDEAIDLLQHLINNWSVLKNTGPDGLRQMFVQREGKLIRKEQGYKLIVERKAQDILLDKLQWNISIVKLPWKDDLLFVEW